MTIAVSTASLQSAKHLRNFNASAMENNEAFKMQHFALN
jgi:hypothetical protein